jgi:Nucleotide modification associated domain 1
LNTELEYRQVILLCKTLFQKKNQDYGTSWRLYRPQALTDKIFIKAKRIRSIQEKGTQKVADDLSGEFIAIINYCIMVMIQQELSLKNDERLELPTAELTDLYDRFAEENFILLQAKNHDYGEAWRDMRVEGMTDEILVKLLRVKQIEDNQGVTIASEGIISNYQDILNYSVFCLIKMGIS